MKVHCKTCDNMVPADDVHSCFDAARVTQHREAERAVIKAAKAIINAVYPPKVENYREYMAALDDLVAAVATLCELEREV